MHGLINNGKEGEHEVHYAMVPGVLPLARSLQACIQAQGIRNSKERGKISFSRITNYGNPT